jgi:oligopeptidase A
MSANPLLQFDDLPAFGAVRPEHVLPAVETALAVHDAAIAAIVAEPSPDFARVYLAKEQADDAVSRLWSIVSHLNGVTNTPEIRAAYGAAQPLMLTHWAKVGQNAELARAIEAVLTANPDLDATRRRAIELAVRDFKLSGVALPEPARSRFAALQVELGRLATEFSNAVLDATRSWTRVLTDEAELAGLPPTERAMLAAAARERQCDGWVVTLDQPSVRAILTFADDRALRAEVYQAFGTRASDQGPDAGRFDNGDRMAEILRLRQESAELLGFATPVASSLATKMAGDAEEVIAFLLDLATRARPLAEAELADMQRFAAAELGLDDLQPWDYGYVAEKIRMARHAIDQSEVQRHLPVPRVIDGLFGLLGRVFGITLTEVANVDAWHPDVRYFALSRDGGAPFAGIYFDLYARAGKRGGAWMGICRSRLRVEGRVRLPVAYLNTNFAAPTGDGPALMSHGDLLTLLHEMGHCLHHVLGEVELPSIGGISGFEWDAVELPSQLMENFGWDADVLATMSGHVETGAPLPPELIARMIGARRFQGGLALLRQVEFALFDIRLHLAAGSADRAAANRTLSEVRDLVAVVRPPAWHRMANGFSHIFAGGYAAGYYSYLWAERLSADAFERFVEVGAAAGGAAFRAEVLAAGASRPALDSFKAFRGRAPENGALLRHYGLAS